MGAERDSVTVLSSSPIYTPLEVGEPREFQVGSFQNSHQNTSDCGGANAHPIATTNCSDPSQPSAPIARRVANSVVWEEPLLESSSPLPTSSNRANAESGILRPMIGEPASSSQCGEETIDSDSDSATDIEGDDGEKLTQNYLEELLTESMLEALPLPPQKKREVRQIYASIT